jgi:hypothetical protein
MVNPTLNPQFQATFSNQNQFLPALLNASYVSCLDLVWLKKRCKLTEVNDENIVVFEKQETILFTLPAAKGTSWCAEWEFSNEDANGPHFLLGRQCWKFSLGTSKRPSASLQSFQTSVASVAAPLPAGEWVQIRCTRGAGKILFEGSHGLRLQVEDPWVDLALRDIEFSFPAQTKVRAFQVSVGGLTPLPEPRRSRPELIKSVTIEFNDDLMSGPWTVETLDQQMEIYRQSGIRRVYFLPTAPPLDGYWRMPEAMYPQHRGNFLKTVENLGDFVPAFAAAARQKGLEFFAVCKLFDEGFEKDWLSFSEPNPAVGLRSLSGYVPRVTDWLARNPDLRLRRHPNDLLVSEKAGPVRILCIEAAFFEGMPEFDIWGSMDNSSYRLWDDAKIVESSPGRIVWEFSEGAPRWIGVMRRQGSGGRFGNILDATVSAKSVTGDAVQLTFGVVTDGNRKRPGRAFPNASFAFDVTQAGPQPVDSRGSYWWFEEGVPLGIVVGVEGHIIGAPSPAYPAVHRHWLKEINRCLDAGCNGVDLRVANHNRSMEWLRYGYDGPLLAVLGENPPLPDVRRFLGNCFTDFVHEAANLVRSRSAKLHVHLEHGFRRPHLPCDLNVFFDWETWVRRGLVDEATLVAHSARSGIMQEMAELCRSNGVAVNIRPYLISSLRCGDSIDLLGEILLEAQTAGVDGFNIYENNTFFRVSAGGVLESHATQFWDRLKNF